MIKATVSLDSVWNLVQSLSIDNQKWLADKVYEEIAQKRRNDKKLVFPHRPVDKEVSPEVMEIVMDRLPVDIDIEAELGKMWEERAK